MDHFPEFIENSLCLDIFNISLLNDNDLNTNEDTEIIIQVYCGEKQKNGKNCFNDNEYHKRFYGKNFNLFYSNSLINMDNKTHPFFITLLKDYMFLNPLLGKFIDVLYYNIKLENDFGIIFESLSVENSIKIDTIQHNYMLNNYPEDYSKNDINLISVTISFTEHAEKYRRVYYKLQNVFAEVTGILKLILFLGRIVVERFSIKFFYTDMINDYFHN